MNVKINKFVTSVGVQNPDLRVFDIVMATKFGTSYNAYIVEGEKTALIETSHRGKSGEFFANIKEAIGEKKIDYIVLNHTEPDHSGALSELLSLYPEAKIYCTAAAGIYLKSITNRPLEINIVKTGSSLSLGGLTLEFFAAPFLHWPDSMFTYLPEANTVFTCDFLGSHYSFAPMLDTAVAEKADYFYALENYFDAIFGPFIPYVRAGLDILGGLDFDTACVSHGPVLTKDGFLPEVLDYYRGRCSEQVSNEIPVFYVSAYGNTRAAAEKFAEGIKSVAGEKFKIELFDIIEHDMAALALKLNASRAFAIGTPTLNRDALPPVWQLLSHIDAINIIKRPAAVFGSFGWSGEAVPAVCERLARLKVNVFGEGFKFNLVPSEDDLKNAENFGAEFAKTL